MTRVSMWFVTIGVVVFAVAVSCGSEQITLPGAGGGGGLAQGGSSASGLEACGGCEPGTFCSASGQCIDDGSCAHADDCAEGMTCDVDTGECVPGGDCGGEQIEIAPLPPDVLFVVDRSCSLTNPQFDMIEAALTKVTTIHDGDARWGLILFPDEEPNNCDQGIQVPIAFGTEAAIQAEMAGTLPNGPCVTNISDALAVAAQQFDGQGDEPGFVVFFTDGQQFSCGGPSEDAVSLQTIGDLLTDKGVHTYVVGFGSGVSPADLNAFAEAGGKALPDPDTKYYLTEDEASVELAFTTILADAISCEYKLLEQPEDGEDIYVFFNDDAAGVPHDETHMEGWDYDEQTSTITFYGSYCEALENGTVNDVDIVFGCPMPVPD